MQKKNNHSSTNNEKKLIDFIELLKSLWLRKILFAKIVFGFILVGVLISLVSPVVYTSHTTFVTQISDKNNLNNSQYSELASLAGLDLNSKSSVDNYISPLVYSKIIDSDEFSMELINEKIYFTNGEALTIKEYILSEPSSFNILGFIYKYTIGLVNFDTNDENISDQFIKEYNIINKIDYSVIQTFKQKFSIETNSKDGYIKVTAEDKNAFISTQYAKLVTRNLQSSIISLRTNKIKEQLDYSREQYEEKKDEFEKLQNSLAEFKDANKNISTAVFLSELQKLESEFQLQKNILMSLASEYNNNKIKLNKDTPIFSVLDEVSVPNQRSKPKRGQIVIIYMFIGIVFSIVFILTKNNLKEVFEKFKNN